MNETSARTNGRVFQGRRALVTGASSGLGAHFAKLLAEGGVQQLFVAARRADGLEKTRETCRSMGAAHVSSIVLDVTDEQSVTHSFDEIKDAGGIDLLVNNVGIATQGAAIDVPPTEFDRVMDTNLRSAWLCAQAAGRMMIGSSGGDIVNIASILGLRVGNSVAPYAISKAALVQMTKALAIEWARHDIRVNALAPGYIETDLNREFFETDGGRALVKRVPMRRLGRLDDLDSPFVLLASGSSRYLTGAVLTVDGGHHINSL